MSTETTTSLQPIRLIIAGSRDIHLNYDTIHELVETHFGVDNVSEVVCGMASGIDMSGYTWASKKGLPITKFPADWSTHGKRAGPMRNALMAKYANAALVIHNGSRGSINMIQCMRALGKTCVEIIR